MSLIESLENRRMLAAQVVLSGRGTLIVDGDENANRVEIEYEDGDNDTTRVRATVYPAEDGDRDDDVATASNSFDLDDVRRIAVFGFGGDDDLTLGSDLNDFTRPVSVFGQNGRDTLNADTNGRVLLDGGADNDVVGRAALLNFSGKRKVRDVLNEYFNDRHGDEFNSPGFERRVSLVGGSGDDELRGTYETIIAEVGQTDEDDVGFVDVVIDEDQTIAARRLLELSQAFYARLGATGLDAADADIVGVGTGDDEDNDFQRFGEDVSDDLDEFGDDVEDFFEDLF